MLRLSVRMYCPARSTLAPFASAAPASREGIYSICVANGLPEALTGSEQAADSGPLRLEEINRGRDRNPAS